MDVKPPRGQRDLAPEFRGSADNGWPRFFDHLERFAASEPDVAIVGILSDERFLTRRLGIKKPPPGWDIALAARLDGWAEGRLGHHGLLSDLLPGALESPSWPRFLLIDAWGAGMSPEDETEAFAFLHAFLRLFPKVRRDRVIIVVTPRPLIQMDRSLTVAYQIAGRLSDNSVQRWALGLSWPPERLRELAGIFGDRHNLLLQAAFRIRRHGGGPAGLAAVLDMPRISEADRESLYQLGERWSREDVETASRPTSPREASEAQAAPAPLPPPVPPPQGSSAGEASVAPPERATPGEAPPSFAAERVPAALVPGALPDDADGADVASDEPPDDRLPEAAEEPPPKVLPDGTVAVPRKHRAGRKSGEIVFERPPSGTATGPPQEEADPGTAVAESAPAPGPSIGRFLALGSTVTATDQLNRSGLVEALAAMLEDARQETPLTIALLGDWGAGKSTLMALLRKRLREESPRRFCFADFNAWEYELTDNMAAGLAQEVVIGLSDDTRPTWRRHRTEPEPGGDPAVREHEVRLSRWLSPGFWWLFGGFVLLRHGARLVGLVALTALGLWLAREHRALLDLAGIVIEPQVLEIAGVTGSLVVLFYLFRGLKHVLEHPFAIGLKTYLHFPQYEHHLGMVPVIKREVETLARLWLGRNWLQRGVASWRLMAPWRKRYPRLDRWSRPRRLVVFVDDLDRCSHARIGQTLDAIRLVMDVPDVVVVLGIDPRIAFQAMALQYEDFADPRRSKEEIARDYLGKIIQVPIRLRRPSEDELDGFVDKRLFAGVRSPRTATSADGGGDGAAITPGDPPPGASFQAADARQMVEEVPHPDATFAAAFAESGGAVDGARVEVVGHAAGMLAATAPIVEIPASPGASSRRHLLEPMRPDANERRWFQELVRVFGFHNPRQLIRLFNSYSLLKLFAEARRLQGEPAAPRADLMRTLFFEELLHEAPSACRTEIEAIVSGGASAAALPPELAARVAAVRSLRLEGGEVDGSRPDDSPLQAPPPAGDWAALADGVWRDFVRLVVLPASADEAPPDESATSEAAFARAALGEAGGPGVVPPESVADAGSLGRGQGGGNEPLAKRTNAASGSRSRRKAPPAS